MKSELKKPNLLGMVMETNFVFILFFSTLILPISAYGNLAKNPSMEGSFITQGSFGDVAEDWTAWAQRKDYGLLGDFLESDLAHGGSKSQQILWYGNWYQKFGYDGMYQQIVSLQAGGLYRASFWFTGRFLGSVDVGGPGGSLYLAGAIGADPEGGTSPGAVDYWKADTVHGIYSISTWDIPQWQNPGVVFSPSASTATIYVMMWGTGKNEGWDYNPNTGTYYLAGRFWEIGAYIDDVLVEPVEISVGSSVEATSPIPANGVERSRVTITVLDKNGAPLQGVPDSEIVVQCTGTDNTIVGPENGTDANGVTTAYITSTVAETKTINVSVFGELLSDTAVVEFVGGPYGPIWYVDADATGANNGSSWADAFTKLQDALTAASAGKEIRVAQGSYKPDQGLWVEPGIRQASFQLISGVTIKGGYAGFGEPDPDARDIDKYKTILSGDLNSDDVLVTDPFDLLDEPTRAENSYHVVTGNGTDETAVLDGFTITAGNANGSSYPSRFGGGMIIENGSPSLTNCTFTGNSGQYGAALGNYNARPALTNCTFSSNSAGYGGVMLNEANSNATVTNCEFRDNWGEYGGGMRNHSSSPTMTDCIFSGNSATYGGGMYNYASSAEVTNCTFTGNSAESYGGGMHNEGNGNPTVTGCLFSSNSADYGGGVLNFSSSPMLTNCTFTDNSADSYGGGIYEFDNSPNVISCVFSGNVAGIGGGGTTIEDSTATLVNCTFSGNDAANGNALACESEPQAPSNVELANCILWDGVGEILNNDGSTITITYSDVQGSWTGMGNIDTAPSFVNPGLWDDNGTPNDPDDDLWVDGDYHLKAASPCIDAGNNTAVPPDANDIDGDGNKTEPIPLDLDGKPRFSDDPDTADTGSGTPPIVDIGAYEFLGTTPNLITGDFCGPNFGTSDGYVDVWDLMQFADQWHTSTGDSNWDSKFDLAGPNFGEPDGYVDVWDLMVFADHWHEGEKP